MELGSSTRGRIERNWFCIKGCEAGNAGISGNQEWEGYNRMAIVHLNAKMEFVENRGRHAGISFVFPLLLFPGKVYVLI